MQSHAVTIKTVEFYEPRTGFAILIVDRLGTTFRVTGDAHNPAPGMTVSIYGQFTDNESLGFVFAAALITTDEKENVLAEIDLSAKQRAQILGAADPFLVDSLPLDKANAAAAALGVPLARRVASCVSAALYRQPIAVGVKQADMEAIVTRFTGGTALDLNQALLSMSATGNVRVTANGTIVSSAAVSDANEIIETLPRNVPIATIDRIGFDRIRGLPECDIADLLPGERDAVFHALNNSLSVINVARTDRAELIAETIIACAERVTDEKPVIVSSKYDFAPGARVVAFCDLNENTEYAAICRAVVDAGHASPFHAPPFLADALESAKDGIANRSLGIPFTARVGNTGVEFSDGHEGDYSLTHVSVESQSQMIDAVEEAIRDNPHSVVIAANRTGEFGSATISGEIHGKQEGVPVAGPFYLGERIDRDGVLDEIEPGAPTDHVTLAWATTIDVAQQQGAKWPTVIVVLPQQKVAWWWAYGCIKLAESRVIFIGSDVAAKSIAKNRPALPVNQAVFDRCMTALAEVDNGKPG